MGILSKLFGKAPAVDYKQLVADGAVILDVRSPGEYQGGHIKGSQNVPLQSLNAVAISRMKKDNPVITCCASGMRSASARRMLLSHGFTRVYNGGGWASLQKKLN